MFSCIRLNVTVSALLISGKAELKPEANVLLAKIGIILEKYADSVIEVEGHTDNVPISTSQFSSNNELSDARARSVFYYLVDNTDLNPANIKHSGRGEYVPVADNSTPEGRAKNRRVEIKIYNSIAQ